MTLKHIYTEQSERPVPCVNVLVFNEKNEVLLLRRNIDPEKGGWGTVGGRVEVSDNNIEESAKREVKEESGFDIELENLVGIIADPYRGKPVDERFYIVQVIYTAHITGGTFTPNEEAQEYEWVSLDEARKKKMVFNHNEIIDLYISKRDAKELIPVKRSVYDEYFDKDFEYRNPDIVRFTANAIILNKKNEILLAHRSQTPYRGFWDFPGGHMYTEETVEQCVSREIKEELGVKCKMKDLFHVYSDRGHSPKAADVISFYFVDIESDDFQKNIEMDGFMYFPLDNLPENIAYNNEPTLLDIKDYLEKK